MKYRLGLDLGTTSLGWAIYDIDKNEIVDRGVRIFDDGRDAKTKASLCVKRREARGARRLVKRHIMKMQTLVKALMEMKLLPESEQERQKLKDLNPYTKLESDDSEEMKKIKEFRRMPLYVLRAKALDEKLELYEIGRIFLQLGQRRGFLSNRKGTSESGGNLAQGNQSLKEKMKLSGARTYGEYLYKKHLEDPEKPIRLKEAINEKGNLADDIEFPYRKEYKDEFEKIWETQQKYYPHQLTNENKEKIKNILFFQRPLKEPEVGFCYLEEGEKRIPKAHPLFQEFRIWQFINNLKIAGESLSEDQREKLFKALMNPNKDKFNYNDMRKVLGLDKYISINFERTDKDLENGKGLPQNKTELAIKKLKSTEENALYIEKLQTFWQKLDFSRKCEIISFLDRPKDFWEAKDLIDLKKEYEKARTFEKQNDLLVSYLQSAYNLEDDCAKILLNDVFFEDGYGNLSKRAINKILPYLKEGLRYDEACKEAGYNHSKKRYEKIDKLPYYGEILKQSCLGAKEDPQNAEERFGKISNATVHVALNQVRYVVNELIQIYGKPSDLSIEYARDLNASAEERKRTMNIQDKNRQENENIRIEIESKCNIKNPSKDDITKYKIWKSMGSGAERRCPYTGEVISVEDLFSAKTEVDHILPFSRTFDDSINNKVVCMTRANRDKGERTPYEAFSSNENNWKEISESVNKLNNERRWRFNKDAMKKFNEMGSPISRLLNDTRYMTRILQQYLLPIVDQEGYETIQAIPGQLTAMVRKVWGLNDYKDKDNVQKYRTEHYHHAIDAAVIAAINRSQIQSISKELNREASSRSDEVNKVFENEHWKLLSKNREKVSKEELSDLKKRINKFIKGRKEEVVSRHVKCPKSLDLEKLKEFISSINISHKSSLKNVHNKHSTIGELHEDTAYGLKDFCKEQGLEANMVNRKKGKKKVNITTYIPIFRDKEDRDAYFDAYKEWFIWEGKSKLIKAKTKEDKELKESLKKSEEEIEQKLRDLAKKAFKWFVSGNNYCMTIYEINENNKIKGIPSNNRGKWEAEVVSNYNATLRVDRGENVSYLPYRWPTSKKVMELRRNDMVVATFTREEINNLPDDNREIDENGKLIKDGTGSSPAPGLRGYLKKKLEKFPDQLEITVLFRVKKIDASKNIYFIPHDIARELSDNDTSWKFVVSNLQEHDIRKVFVSPTGKIKYA